MTDALPHADASSADASRPTALDAIQCPGCQAALDVSVRDISCASCGRAYPRLGEIPILLTDPQDYLASCRKQLELLESRGARMTQEVRAQLQTPDVLPLTRRRCLGMIEAIEGQLSDVRSLLEPMLPGPTSEGQAHPDTVPATIQYLPYLYRDWGWAHETDGENEYALAAVDRVLDGRALGRTLVLGAGGCRLAYDLHRRDPDAELVVLDVDPLLFAAAYAVTHGETLSVREANLEIGAMDQCSMEWRLSAPDGPVHDDRFHFILADGVDPPFFQNTFDTVLTPWFIDQGPEDMRDLISTIHLLLKGDGCWLNLGPLAYEPEIPAALRFSSDEVFDLARRAGFWLHRSTTDSVPYLVSKLNGRGKVEWVLAFAATKVARPSGAEVGEGPPDWLIFRHVPIPTFEGQPVFWSEEPVVQTVVSAIDGTRTLDDITRIVARQASRSGLSMSQLRQAVRQCLGGLHPACRTSEGPAG